jgi:hypothetical protein
METSIVKVKETLKYPFSKTLIEYRQSIDNLKRQDTNGQYTERIALLVNELAEAEIWVFVNTNTKAPEKLDQSAELKAIMLFNTHPNFTITE